MAQVGKSPYEIREDLLELAYKICLEQCHAANACSAIKCSPTVEQVIETANQLNSFICAKS